MLCVLNGRRMRAECVAAEQAGAKRLMQHVSHVMSSMQGVAVAEPFTL
jgi:hypothetical protein